MLGLKVAKFTSSISKDIFSVPSEQRVESFVHLKMGTIW
jgi:hypothetical protein